MSRDRTGSVESCKRADGSTYYRARVWLADGTRDRVIVPEKYGYSRERAELYAEALQENEDETGELLAKKRERIAKQPSRAAKPGTETISQWFGRYIETTDAGASHRSKSKYQWSKWIDPVIGSKRPADLTRDLIEDVRDGLDVAIDAGELAPSTAANVWSVLTKALKSACNARDRSLRVLAAPLHVAILPPKRGAGRSRPWLYPSEWTTLAACAEVPVEYSQLFALELYTGLRPGELRALRWADVDLKAGVLSVARAFDEETGEIKDTKTEASRRTIPIQPNLTPLLEALAGEPGELVVDGLPRFDDLAQRFRELLALAGVKRPRLTADNATEEPIDFRSLRDTHATWLAIAGVNDKIIMRRLGHTLAQTTDRYIKAAEAFGDATIGETFPPLPIEMLIRPRKRPRNSQVRGTMVARVGFESGQTAGKPSDRDDSRKLEAQLSTRVDVSNSPPGHMYNASTSRVDCTDLERAIVEATLQGNAEVARLLAELLRERRRAATGVIDLDTVRGKKR